MSGPDAIEVAATASQNLAGYAYRQADARVVLDALASAAGLPSDADGSVVLTRRAGEWEVAGRDALAEDPMSVLRELADAGVLPGLWMVAERYHTCEHGCSYAGGICRYHAAVNRAIRLLNAVELRR